MNYEDRIALETIANDSGRSAEERQAALDALAADGAPPAEAAPSQSWYPAA